MGAGGCWCVGHLVIAARRASAPDGPVPDLPRGPRAVAGRRRPRVSPVTPARSTTNAFLALTWCARVQGAGAGGCVGQQVRRAGDSVRLPAVRPAAGRRTGRSRAAAGARTGCQEGAAVQRIPHHRFPPVLVAAVRRRVVPSDAGFLTPMLVAALLVGGVAVVRGLAVCLRRAPPNVAERGIGRQGHALAIGPWHCDYWL